MCKETNRKEVKRLTSVSELKRILRRNGFVPAGVIGKKFAVRAEYGYRGASLADRSERLARDLAVYGREFVMIHN